MEIINARSTATNTKYNILYADPPWSYKAWNAKKGHKSAAAHYPTMSLPEICTLPIQTMAANDCVLFLWATYPNLPQALQVMATWGFNYKTVAFTWVKTYKSGKPVIGLGYWTRANAEICLIGVKGRLRRKNNSVSQIILAPQREHSRKPDEARERIVQLMGDLPRIELFARQQYEGWDVWGNEVNKFMSEEKEVIEA